MATLARDEIVSALTRLGALAGACGTRIDVLLFGGALMALRYNARASTRDVDVVIEAPPDLAQVRSLAAKVAKEFGWPEDWLNDAVKGFVHNRSESVVLLEFPGIVIRCPDPAQLLAMKLCAWRDDLDISDARRILQEMEGTRENLWGRIQPFLIPGTELKAEYALLDLWESIHGPL